MTRSRAAIAVLLGAAAVGAIVRSANATTLGRIGGTVAALVLVGAGAAAWRGQRWALGAAFLLAVCWVWAVVALALQGVIAGAEAVVWLMWAVAVMWASIAGREAPAGPRFPPMRTGVGDDEGDGGQGLHAQG